jgi:hypothetical protein
MPKKRKNNGPSGPKHNKNRRRANLPRAIAPNKLPDGLSDQAIDKVRNGKPLASILAFAGIKSGDELESSYETIVGLLPAARLLASNLVERDRMKAALISTAATLTEKDDMEFALVHQSISRRDASDLNIAVATARRKVEVYEKSGASSITTLALVPWPSEDDTLGFCMELQARSLLFGPGVRAHVDRLQRAKPSSKAAGGPRPFTMKWLDLDEPKTASAAIRALMSIAPDPEAKAAAATLAMKDWKKHQGLRTFVLVQCLSMLPMSKMFLAQGRGREILGAVLSPAEARIKESMRRTVAAIHRDGMAHFWFRELRRLDLGDLNVPLLKL